MAKATDTITDSEDIVKLAKPGDYYQVRAHHMFSRILNLLYAIVISRKIQEKRMSF